MDCSMLYSVALQLSSLIQCTKCGGDASETDATAAAYQNDLVTASLLLQQYNCWNGQVSQSGATSGAVVVPSRNSWIASCANSRCNISAANLPVDGGWSDYDAPV